MVDMAVPVQIQDQSPLDDGLQQQGVKRCKDGYPGPRSALLGCFRLLVHDVCQERSGLAVLQLLSWTAASTAR